MRVAYDGLFTVDGADIKTPFDRYDCPFCRAQRGDKTIVVDSGAHTLSLSLREENN